MEKLKIISVNQKTNKTTRHKNKDTALNFVYAKGGNEKLKYKIFKVDSLGRNRVEILQDGREIVLKKS